MPVPVFLILSSLLTTHWLFVSLGAGGKEGVCVCVGVGWVGGTSSPSLPAPSRPAAECATKTCAPDTVGGRVSPHVHTLTRSTVF